MEKLLLNFLLLLPGFHVNNLSYLFNFTKIELLSLIFLQNFYDIIKPALFGYYNINNLLYTKNKKDIAYLLFLFLIYHLFYILMTYPSYYLLLFLKPYKKFISPILFSILYIILFKNIYNPHYKKEFILFTLLGFISLFLNFKDVILFYISYSISIPFLFIKENVKEITHKLNKEIIEELFLFYVLSYIIVLSPATSPVIVSLIFKKNYDKLIRSLIFLNVADSFLSSIYYLIYKNPRIGALSKIKNIYISDIIYSSIITIPIFLILIYFLSKINVNFDNIFFKIISIFTIIFVNLMVNGIFEVLLLIFLSYMSYKLLRKLNKLITLFPFYVWMIYFYLFRYF